MNVKQILNKMWALLIADMFAKDFYIVDFQICDGLCLREVMTSKFQWRKDRYSLEESAFVTVSRGHSFDSSHIFRVDERRGISSCLRRGDEAEVTIRYFLSVEQERGSERERALLLERRKK